MAGPSAFPARQHDGLDSGSLGLGDLYPEVRVALAVPVKPGHLAVGLRVGGDEELLHPLRMTHSILFSTAGTSTRCGIKKPFLPCNRGTKLKFLTDLRDMSIKNENRE